MPLKCKLYPKERLGGRGGKGLCDCWKCSGKENAEAARCRILGLSSVMYLVAASAVATP